MAAKHLLVALLASLALSAAVEARLFQDDAPLTRSLQQVNTRCPAGCADGACVLDSTSGGYKCTACKNSLVVDPDSGACQCPAGRYATTANGQPNGTPNDNCADCDKGSYCAGGKYVSSTNAALNPGQTPCPNSLSTIGKRSISLKACVNTQGNFYVPGVGNADPSQTTCPVNTYGPGWRKQRACVPCPPGFITTSDGKSKASDCVVPAGYYLKGPGQVAPCPKGEYKSTVGALASCDKCAAGVTTENEASTSKSDCKVVLPTFYPAAIVDGEVTSTEKCPQKYYCEGGTATAEFDITQTNPVANKATNTVQKCADGTWTEGTGASAATQCMTPPGYYTSGTSTSPCPANEYRAEWKPAVQAGACVACGENISAEDTEEITQYALDGTASKVYVRASAAACFINPGQGMYFSPATNKYTAVNCDTNNYGVADKTFGLAAYPCRDCPAGMQTSATLSPSSTKATNGYKDPMACVTKAGYGYNGRVANQCPVGSWNDAGNYKTCTQCNVGYTTDGAGADEAIDCKVAPGYGYYSNIDKVIPCPVGTYNDAVMGSTPTECTSCGTGLTTSQAGGRSSADCNLCKPGYGGDACGTQCTGNKFGVAGREKDSACETCPTMTIGFSFDYLGANQAYTPAAVARTGAESAADCLAEFAQIEDSAWYMGPTTGMTDITSSLTDGVNFANCVAACKTDDTCQYITYDYDASKCYKKADGTGADGEVLAFKAVVAGDTTAASKSTDAKALASGSYTFWKDATTNVGTATANSATTVADCLSACDKDAACAAVAMEGAVSLTAQITCKLIKGDSSVAQFKRSVTKVKVGQLTLAQAA